MSEVIRKVFHCDRCNWEWIPEADKIPERCPNRKCRTRRWNVTEPAVGKTGEEVLMLYNATCAKCGGATVTWGPVMVRCVKCEINYPL